MQAEEFRGANKSHKSRKKLKHVESKQANYNGIRDGSLSTLWESINFNKSNKQCFFFAKKRISWKIHLLIEFKKVQSFYANKKY